MSPNLAAAISLIAGSGCDCATSLGLTCQAVVMAVESDERRSKRRHHRTLFDRAAELAKKVGGEAVAWESLESVLGLPDILVTSVSSASPVLSRELLERAIAARSGRPVFVVDLAVPRNVAPEAAGLYNLYLYNIDDLGEIVEQNKKAREAEIPRAEAIISEHIAKFEAWRAAL